MSLFNKLTKSIKCPIFRIKRHASPPGGFFQRVLGKITRISGLNQDLQIKENKKTQSSNAEFHLTIKQIQKLIRACKSTREKLLIQMMVYTGIRRAEIADLDISDIRWSENLILIRKGKGNKQRLVPLPPLIFNELKSFLAKRTHGAVFESRRRGNLGCRQLNRIVADIGHRARVINPNPKYLNITCHLLRHTFARYWKQNQGSMESLSYILGHASQATTMDLYGKESITEMQENYNDVLNKIFKLK